MNEGIYRCPVLDDEVDLFKKALKEYGYEKYDISDFHKKSELMADISMVMSDFRGDAFSILPFCHTVEAEAFGARVNFGDGKNFPRIKEHRYKSLSDISDLDDIDFSRGRVSEVLDAISIIKKNSRRVILEVSGPLNILNALIDPIVIYRELNKYGKSRKNNDNLRKGMIVDKDVLVENSDIIRNRFENKSSEVKDRETENIIRMTESTDSERNKNFDLELTFEKLFKNILKYISRSVDLGVDVISFSDSTGSIEFLGRRMAETFYKEFLVEFLKKVEQIVRERCIFHICPKLSFSMKDLGFLDFILLENIIDSEDLSYHDFLTRIDKNKVVFLGDRCINFNKKIENISFLELI